MLNLQSKTSELNFLARNLYPEYEELDFLNKEAIDSFAKDPNKTIGDFIFNIVNSSYCSGFNQARSQVLKLVAKNKRKELQELLRIHKIK